VVAAAVACLAAVPAPAQAATNSCRAESMRSGNTVHSANRAAVLFASRRLKQDVACTYKDRRLVRLGSVVCCQLERYALGARYLGYAYRLDEADNEVDELGVFDLKTGKRLRYKQTSGASTVDTNGYVRSFYVTAKGTLAWVQAFQANDAQPNPTDIAVRAIAAGGTTQTLDTGNIDSSSFAISVGGKTLYWSKDGAVKSAPIQ
jgi:hypothetical protein